MSLSYNNVLPAALDKNYMVFLNWRWNFHSADIFKLVKGNLKTNSLTSGLLFTYLQTQTNNLERQYESNDSLDSALM